MSTKPKLDLDPAVIAKARSLARKAGAQVVKIAKTHTTVSVERAVLRLAGQDPKLVTDGALFVAVQALKHQEDAVGELLVQTDAVVAHREDPFLTVPFGGNVNPRRSLAAELDGVAKEILKQPNDLAEIPL